MDTWSLMESWGVPMEVIEKFRDTTDDAIWLQNNTDPWEEVLKRWDKTFPERQKSQCSTVHQYLEKWPILKLQKGHLLDAGDIDNVIQKQNQKASSVNLTVQPYILVVGKLHDFSAIYIVIDDVKKAESWKAFKQGGIRIRITSDCESGGPYAIP
ncbi:hypothetical protein MSG28_008955 [Choristoneura fumiferana]|uniref:Uncharacterized protein n=1 Tax=Choristoneura fumiferana TaxID=7141 RepID=A0ACC0J8M5_CHOFU|nr:hypothetical protein MSG28_008955 [Choristoneura fumiferana]